MNPCGTEWDRLSVDKREDGRLSELYESKPEDRKNPYFAPLCAEDYTNLPDTLIPDG